MVERNRDRVRLTVEVPLDVAEFLVEDGDKIIAAFRRAILNYRRNPPAERRSEIEAARERKRAERVRRFTHLGRVGYRMLRARQADVEYINRHGQLRQAGTREKAGARKALVWDIASELKQNREHIELAIRQFRKRLHDKLRDRRRREVARYVAQGLSNIEIGDRLGVHAATVASDLRHIRAAYQREGNE